MNEGRSSGLGVFGVCLVVFVILKLTNLITWSWWWVLSPIWIYILLVIVFFIILILIELYENKRKG